MDRERVLKTIKFSFITLTAVVIIFLVIFQTRKLVTGPKIEIISPKNGQIFSSSTIVIEGKIINATETKLNDRPIFIDRDGNFKEIIILSPGINYEKIYGKDRFGKEKETILDLIYSP